MTATAFHVFVIAWTIAGCLVAAWWWHVEREEIWWAGQAATVRDNFAFNPALALVQGLMLGLLLLTLAAAFIVGWWGVVLGRSIRERRKGGR